MNTYLLYKMKTLVIQTLMPRVIDEYVILIQNENIGDSNLDAMSWTVLRYTGQIHVHRRHIHQLCELILQEKEH